ncbi:hypothetical protein GRI35_03565 [Altererythrobacter aestiaquae]|uniref:Uncharacterized protein n=2 Tax=Pontixanthobacter aestiaquae TaxID=1509367 RepID=A0A844Z3E6_9SPHN|nr:hypothetical protein [Pontixanthobacter aestiaquae]
MAMLYTVLTFGATLAPAAAEARTASTYYTAELSTPAKEARTIIRGVVWYCKDTTCRAKKSNSRPVNVCKRLSNEMGEITSFTAKDKALADEKLAKCNS